MSGEVTVREMVSCLERELRLRKYVYWRRVKNEQMTREEAEREILVMSEILEIVRSQEEPKLL